MATPRRHLALLGSYRCTCGDRASRLMRCRVGGCVIARCATHGASMERVRDEHEAGCQAGGR